MRGDVASGLGIDQDGLPLNVSAQIREAIFVVALGGEVIFSFDTSRHRHSSLVAGADVTAAGTMRVLNGKILEVDNFSGHYRPPAASLAVFAERMRQLGISLEETLIETADRRPNSSRGSSAMPPAMIDCQASTHGMARPQPRQR